MAILSRFARDERFSEIDGCPLAPCRGGREERCATCDFNVLNPGRGRVGCVLSTPYAAYQRALGHLAQISRPDHDRLVAILDGERRTGNDEGMSTENMAMVKEIAARWWGLVGNDEAERQVVAALLRFAEAGLKTGEPVRVLA